MTLGKSSEKEQDDAVRLVEDVEDIKRRGGRRKGAGEGRGLGGRGGGCCLKRLHYNSLRRRADCLLYQPPESTAKSHQV